MREKGGGGKGVFIDVLIECVLGMSLFYIVLALADGIDREHD